ncbi:putative plant self-incompatibility S1 [Rosa chinensis]|uniref:Putative plant self-incompatibility S1 n=1 Tax=Rosa chinensis TaxID=74649 RepID=A0A2P6QRX3_ROSCH|nr:putative plant self-incompatibility S1 [Rosa chinensis]
MLSRSHIFFLLIPVLFSFTSMLCSSDELEYKFLLRVHIINALPQNSKPANIECKSTDTYIGERNLNVGDDFTWNAKESSLYYCRAFWGRFFASWHAVQPKRDDGKAAVFWLVNEHGFFLSWDNSTWVKKSVWETE